MSPQCVSQQEEEEEETDELPSLLAAVCCCVLPHSATHCSVSSSQHMLCLYLEADGWFGVGTATVLMMTRKKGARAEAQRGAERWREESRWRGQVLRRQEAEGERAGGKERK